MPNELNDQVKTLLDNDDFRFEYQNTPDADCLILIFASAGLAFGGKPVNEFKKTLDNAQIKEPTSIGWIHDKRRSWFNTPSVALLENELLNLCAKYKNTVTLGESLGGCGAIHFGGIIQAKRILAFGPQFSMKKPFINFNTNLGPPTINNISIDNYAPDNARERTLVLFGADSWQDTIHAWFFQANEYNVKFVDGAHHNVARRLKDCDLLGKTLKSLVDFDSFNEEERFSETSQLLSKYLLSAPSNKGLSF